MNIPRSISKVTDIAGGHFQDLIIKTAHFFRIVAKNKNHDRTSNSFIIIVWCYLLKDKGVETMKERYMDGNYIFSTVLFCFFMMLGFIILVEYLRMVFK